MKKIINIISRNNKQGYTLMYSLVAMVVCCALVFSTISVSTYYNNSLARKTGSRGSLMAAQSGIELTEEYLNLCYLDKYSGARTASELYRRINDALDAFPATNASLGTNTCKLILQGYSNYYFKTDAGTSSNSASSELYPDAEASISYKTYYLCSSQSNLISRGELTILSLGEYVVNNKAYYKFITVTVLIQPNVDDTGIISSFDFKTIQYYETLKGGTELWGNVQW